MVLDSYLKGMLEELRAIGVKRVVFENLDLSRPREVEFFDAMPPTKSESETETVELPIDDGVPMGAKNAADLLMRKKPRERAA